MPQSLLNSDLITADEFDRLGDAAHGYELVDGHLVEKPMSVLADYTSARTVRKVGEYLDDHPIGLVLGSESGYRMGVPNARRQVRKPDVSVVAIEQVHQQGLPEGSITGRPLLAFESVSPKDRTYELEQKLSEYRRAGVPLIWIVYAGLRVGRVMDADGSTRLIAEEGGVFDGGEVLPGLRIPLADILPPRDLTPPAPPAVEDDGD